MSERPIDAATYAEAERRLGALLGTERDTLLLQGEAILVLEASARGLGGPGVRALNLVSGPYGEVIGDWLAAGGAAVETVTGAFDAALTADSVGRALAAERFDLVSIVHAEAATGVVNPLPEIAAAAHAAGALVLVDAVASVGAEPLEIDAWDLDLVMLGLQKAPGGPNGVSALVASDRGWSAIQRNPSAPRGSILSLLDWKDSWIDAGRRRIPGYPHEHEMRAFGAMLDRLAGDPGLGRCIASHRRARDAVRAGAGALGLEPWVADDLDAASVVTLVRPPAGVAVSELLAAAAPSLDGSPLALLTAAPEPLAEQAVRINHTGPGAEPAAVLSALTALAGALEALGRAGDIRAALGAARQALSDDPSSR